MYYTNIRQGQDTESYDSACQYAWREQGYYLQGHKATDQVANSATLCQKWVVLINTGRKRSDRLISQDVTGKSSRDSNYFFALAGLFFALAAGFLVIVFFTAGFLAAFAAGFLGFETFFVGDLARGFLVVAVTCKTREEECVVK